MTAPFIPQFLAPSAPGQLSNTRGSNTGGDAIGIKTRQANPKGIANPLSLMRIQCLRTALNGLPSSPQLFWDSGWGGGNPACQFLPAPKQACGGNSTVTYGGRIYFMPNDGTISSAPCIGPAIGKFRYENPLTSPSQPNSIPVVYSMTIVANRIYASATVIQYGSSQASLYVATINADGTLGAWGIVPGIVVQLDTAWKNSYICGGWDGKSTTGWIVYGNTVAGVITTLTINISDGSSTLAPTTANLPTVARDNASFVFVAVSNTANVYDIFMIGGAAGAAQTVVDRATINPSTGLSIGAFAAGAPLPLLRGGGTGIVLQDGTVYYMGGSNNGAAAGVQTSVYYTTSARIDALTAWNTSAQVLPVAAWFAGGGVISNDWDLNPSPNTSTNPGICVIGGQLSGGALRQFVVSSIVNGISLPNDVLAWNTVSGNGTAAVVGNFGVGAAIVANQDGTQDITVNYGAIFTNTMAGTNGVLIAGGFNDGDQITVIVTHVGTDGDYSPTAVTVIKIGQPPSITSILPSGATSDGQPILSFNFNPGTGGDLEFSYRIQLAPAVFDSGVRYDSANSVLFLGAPYLPTGVLQTITVTVVSRDTPMAGSTATATATGTFTPTLTAPGTPSGLTATPNHAAGLIALAWTNNAPAGTTPGNRVYYRRNGSSTWILLAESLTAITSYNAMDQIAAAVGYDFAVSQIDDNSDSESPLSNVASNAKIDPVVGGWSGFIHIAGQGTTHFAPLLVQESPDVTATFDTTATLPFQQLTPTVTIGVAHYAKLKLRVFVPTLANQKQVMDVIATAYLGNVAYYRDGFGAMIVVQIDPEQTEVYRPPVAREQTLSLTQIANQFQPSTAQGSATGYLQQLFNSIIPLDPSEAML